MSTLPRDVFVLVYENIIHIFFLSLERKIVISFYFRHIKAVALYAELKALSKGIILVCTIRYKNVQCSMSIHLFGEDLCNTSRAFQEWLFTYTSDSNLLDKKSNVEIEKDLQTSVTACFEKMKNCNGIFTF